jgi:CHAD domain-containing protein
MNRLANDPGRDLLIAKIAEAIALFEPGDIDDARVHAARRALKGARTALRLLRPRLDDSDLSACNIALRDAARILSQLRDLRSLLVAFEAIDRGSRNRLAIKAVLARLRPLLHARLEQARMVLERDPAVMRHCADSLRGSLERTLAALREATDDRQLVEAFVQIYRRARHSFRRVVPRSGDEKLHEWRKQTKYLLTAATALRNSGKKNLNDLVKRADRVADQLGDDHDLAILAQKLPDLAGASDSRLLLPLIERRRAVLQRKALRDGAKLFASNPHRVAVNLSNDGTQKARPKFTVKAALSSA